MKQVRACELVAIAIALYGLSACGSTREPEVHTRPAVKRTVRPDAGMTPDAGEPQARAPAFCARAGADQVRDAFCGDAPPEISSLRDLQVLLGFRPAQEPPPPSLNTLDQSNAYYTLASVVVLGHSTALSGRLVSPINPRVITMSTNTFMAFQRGVQHVELISRARDKPDLNLYLLSFAQACNQNENGCRPGDLYTPRIESDWLDVRIEDAEELKNTPADCRQCHQRARERAQLLMRELESPWTHFFFPRGVTSPMPGPTGSDLMVDYLSAKGAELYGGFPLHTISSSAPFFLQSMAGPEQPLLFDAPEIESERYPYGPDGYAKEAQPSPTWESGYEAFKRGEQLALPSVEVRASDPEKQAALTAAYVRYAKNEIGADELPEMSDIFPDDPHERARRGLETEPDATPEDALIQACASCHNDVLDQTVSRARFNVSVSRLERYELDLAIDRISRARDEVGVMPPPDARQLAPEVRDRLRDYLKGQVRALDPEGHLERASKLGMTGGGGSRPAIGAL